MCFHIIAYFYVLYKVNSGLLVLVDKLFSFQSPQTAQNDTVLKGLKVVPSENEIIKSPYRGLWTK